MPRRTLTESVLEPESWTDADSPHLAQVRTLILINLGGAVDILAVFPFLPNTCTIHIIDSHRPTHLRNLHVRHPLTTAVFDDRREWDPARDEELPDNGVDEEGVRVGQESAVCVWVDKEGEDQRKDLMELMSVMEVRSHGWQLVHRNADSLLWRSSSLQMTTTTTTTTTTRTTRRQRRPSGHDWPVGVATKMQTGVHQSEDEARRRCAL